MMHTRRLLGAVAGVASAGVVSTWLYHPDDAADPLQSPNGRPSARSRSFDETKGSASSSAASSPILTPRYYAVEQSPFRDLGDLLASATVSASQAYMSWLATSGMDNSTTTRHSDDPFRLVDPSTPLTSKDAKRVIDSSQFSILLNAIAGDTRDQCPDASYKAINQLATNMECAAAIAERATRYGKKALLHLAKRHNVDPRLGDALRALTVLDGVECRFGPANLNSLVALVCTPNLPAPFAEFAWWALAATASNKALTPRYRWRKEWLGDDRVARTRSILMRNSYVWSAILAARDDSSNSSMVQLHAARLVKEMCASGLPIEDDDRLDLILHWLSSENVPLCAEALQTVTSLAAHESVRVKLAARGALDILHQKIEANTSDARLTALLLGAVHALAFHHATSLDDHALSSVDNATPNVDHDEYVDVFDFDEPTVVRGWIDLFTSYATHDDADIAANAVACLDAISSHGTYRNQGMQEWVIAVLDSVLENVPLDVQRQATTVRAARSRTRPLKSEKQNSPTQYVLAHTRALRALAFVLDRPDCQAAFVRAGGLPLLRSMLKSIEASTEVDAVAVTGLQQEWSRVVANMLSAPSPLVLEELRHPAWTSRLQHLAYTSANVQVQTHAARALHNLHTASQAHDALTSAASHDVDDMPVPKASDGAIYMEGVHPFTLPKSDQPSTNDYDVDVVFVHGLLGCAFETWAGGAQDGTAADVVWAHEWLVADLQHQHVNPRVVSLGYDSKLFAAESSFETLCFDDTSKDLLTKLQKAKIGVDRPVVFVTHSMGGLVVKKMLHDAATSSLAQHTKGLVFYGVPHHGSPVAAAIFPISSAVQRQGIAFQHPVTSELHGTPRLEALNEWCAGFVKEHDVRVLSVGESAPMRLPLVGVEALVVPEASSNPGFGTYIKLPNLDHTQVCKPVSTEDLRYTLARDLIVDAVAKSIADENTMTEID
ncbi:hypothetical protein H310_00173 [Aphanomyces invadans]|uniref:Protein SERAC1 n=1 Tax=Aphanomyces invadans TaxID=157072 RepID=A0A024UT06_9STRA|nr:hypothetical protein H310_00173 [Aphanomyces invadans]ETW09656.1 hypothetical protein H310_00173 [Aphanomyces invadans]|eukprot:XP_008861067.1 hypothetical protein H310_00173 [Aphanomyces invadans]